jgi:hypothetical protein
MVLGSGSPALRLDGAGLTRAGPGAGFSLHRHLPSRLGLLVGSTSVWRLPATLGDVLHELGEVTSGIQVAVDPQPHVSQAKVRSARVSLAFTHPHAEHVLEEG